MAQADLVITLGRKLDYQLGYGSPAVFPDARFLRSVCPVIEFGLTNATMHKTDEAVAMADLDSLSRIYTAIAKAALGGN